MIDLRLGAWQDVLADVEVDAVVTDPPYSKGTHAGHNSLKRDDGCIHNKVTYEHWTPKDVRLFVEHWHERTRGWIVAMTDDRLSLCWRAAFRRVGRLDFTAIPCVMPGMTVRMAGDGPSSWTIFLMVGRPRNKEFATWGTLPGYYPATRGSEWQDGGGGGRGKPREWMEAIVRDYTAPGDLVADPLCGYGATLKACRILGRRSVAAEVDVATYEKARTALALPFAPDLLTHSLVHGSRVVEPTAEQVALFGRDE